MITWIILIACLIVCVAAGSWLWGRFLGRQELLPAMNAQERVNLIAANSQAVAEGRFDDIQLEVAPRGYRQDQVDALIAQLISGTEASKTDII